MTRQSTGSTTVSSSAGSSRNTSGIRMGAHYSPSHRITAVHTTVTLVLRDATLHTASLTRWNEHRLPPFSSCCADHSKSLNFLFLPVSSVLCSILCQHSLMLRSFQISSLESITLIQWHLPLQSVSSQFTSCTVQQELETSFLSLAVCNENCALSSPGATRTSTRPDSCATPQVLFSCPKQVLEADIPIKGCPVCVCFEYAALSKPMVSLS